MEFKSINPFNGEEVGSYTGLAVDELDAKLADSNKAFVAWRNVAIEDRAKLMVKAGEVLRMNREEYAKMITLEMGKPITE